MNLCKSTVPATEKCSSNICNYGKVLLRWPYDWAPCTSPTMQLQLAIQSLLWKTTSASFGGWGGDCSWCVCNSKAALPPWGPQGPFIAPWSSSCDYEWPHPSFSGASCGCFPRVYSLWLSSCLTANIFSRERGEQCRWWG